MRLECLGSQAWHKLIVSYIEMAWFLWHANNESRDDLRLKAEVEMETKIS